MGGQWDAPDYTRGKNVGAGLLAKAVGQSIHHYLDDRYRGQARLPHLNGGGHSANVARQKSVWELACLRWRWGCWKSVTDTPALIVPTLCVGMPPWTLCVRFQGRDAERHRMHSHAEHGNDHLCIVLVSSDTTSLQASLHSQASTNGCTRAGRSGVARGCATIPTAGSG